MVKCIKVPLKEAEKIKRKLLDENKLNDDYYPLKEDEFIYFPSLDGTIEKTLNKRQKKLITPFKEALKEILNEKELSEVKTAFDTIGTIAILEIPDSLDSKAQLIGETLLKSNPTIKTVLKKSSIHSGVFRVQERSFLAGVNTQIAKYRENNVDLEVNVNEVYFSVRLSTERTRISKLIKEGEDVLVMFSGAAPYPCVFAKNTLAKQIIGVEINPIGHEYGLKNVLKNKIKNVTLINGDVRDVVPEIYKYIIGLKAANTDVQMNSRLIHNPKVFEFHLREDDLFSKKDDLIKRIKELKNKGIKILLHMPFPNHHTALLGNKDAVPEIEHFKLLGNICKENNVNAIIHITWEYPVVSKEQVIKNIKALRDYYDYFYFENLTHYFSTTEDILEISKAAQIKNVCIDVAHLYMTYKNNDKIINHIKVMQKNFNTYFHISDSDGTVDGLNIGTGKIDIDKILNYVNLGIVEIKSPSEETGEHMIESYNYILSKQKKFDRIVMPLPKTAEEFLDIALKASKKGTMIHLYGFYDEDKFEEAKKYVLNYCKNLGYDVELID
ncbi:MAG: hypothetical protein AB7V77_05385, partial [Candidatus Woesearchaeota archaeon]